jgi:hypothetical protein
MMLLQLDQILTGRQTAHSLLGNLKSGCANIYQVLCNTSGLHELNRHFTFKEGIKALDIPVKLFRRLKILLMISALSADWPCHDAEAPES